MLIILNSLKKSFSHRLHELSRPNSKYFIEKDQFKLEHSRNKIFLLIHIPVIIQLSVNLAINNGEVLSNLQAMIATVSINSILLITCHYNLHPQIFKTIYNLFVLSYGVLFLTNGDHGIIGAWLVAPIFPILVYLLTGSIHHFIFNFISQAILVNTFYQQLMRKALQSVPVEEYLSSFTYFSNQNIAYCLIYTLLSHYAIQSAFYKIKVAEQKKDDFEKQKNFLLGFSHELRNLINNLMGNVKLASLESPSEKVKDLLLNAEVCAEVLLHLVNNILDTGKVEIGELEINPVSTRVYDTMERIWGVCSELIRLKNLRGRLKIQRDIPQILVLDHYRVTQVFLNLVGNAVKYTDNGQIDITVEWINGRESVDERCFEPIPFNDSDEHDEGIFEKSQSMCMLDDNFIILNFSRKKIDRKLLIRRRNAKNGVLKITVTDTGCGILREDLGILFQRFTQGTIDASKKKLGTGLGLFITKELCKRMRGDVRVFSKRNVGSAFSFCLPLEPVTDERAFFFGLEGIQRAVSQQRLRAMVVDDELFAQCILRDFLHRLNIDVVDVAENGLVAYKRFVERYGRRDSVNIVTMDLQMPVMDGKQAAHKIRRYEAAKQLKSCLLIVVSANCSDSEISMCLDKNGDIRADAFLKKPVRIDELCRVISCHLSQLQFENQERVRLLTE